MAKKKSPRKRPAVSVTASKALSQLAEQPLHPFAPHAVRDLDRESGTREKRSSGVFEELYAGELRRRAEVLAAEVQGSELESGPKLTAVAHVADTRTAPRTAREEQRIAAEAEAHAVAERQAAEDLADDASIPPVDVEAEQFFAEGESRASMPHLWAAPEEHLDLEEPHSDHVRRASPEVLARRAKLRKVAQRVVAAFAVIAIAGLGKAVLTRAPSAELPLQSSVAHAAAALEEHPAQVDAPRAPAAEAKRVAVIPPPEPAAIEEVAKVAEPAKSEAPVVSAVPAPAPEAAKPIEEAKPAEAAPAPSGDAKADKKAAQRAIDRGDNKGAVEAGERALQIDSTDAETWLIVGAAYQQMGQGAKARQAFSSCVSKSTHGPKGECAALR